MNLAQEVKNNLGVIGLADAYKPTHHFQYPPNTEKVAVYLEARKPGKDFGHSRVVIYGDHLFNRQYLEEPITFDQLANSVEFWKDVGVPFPEEDCRHLVENLQGKLPLEIRSLPDGTVADVHTAIYTMTSTDKRYWWLPAFMETIKQQNTWYPCSVATLSWTVKLAQADFHLRSSDLPLSTLDYKLHDFGFRAVTCLEQGIIGGMANALNYKGSDTSVANEGVNLAYSRELRSEPATTSISAMEHMTSTAWGKDNEDKAIENFIRRVCLQGLMGSVIIDTYDTDNCIDNILGDRLFDLIENDVAKAGGVVIARPDSGDPVEVPVRCIEKLMKIFGYDVNRKGYKVLPSYVRVIQGDGMSLTSIQALYEEMDKRKLSLDNIAVGMGGGLLQKVNRDMMSMSQKGSCVTVDGETYGISKDPITDPGKKSQEGEFSVISEDNKLVNVPRGSVPESEDLLRVVYLNGPVNGVEDVLFEQPRLRAKKGFIDELTIRHGYPDQLVEYIEEYLKEAYLLENRLNRYKKPF